VRWTLALALVACSSSSSAPPPETFTFGPYHLAPSQEITDQCVSATLHNETELAINAVELTTATGFHHSNWFFVPDNRYDGPDGTWPCSDRMFDQANAGTAGGVLFAQSTQSPHEIQQFPKGVAIVIPPHSRIVATTHLLDAGDTALDVPLSLKITPIADVTTRLAALSFENESIQIPPHRKSRFTIECDVGTQSRNLTGQPPDFNIYYVLAHYHTLGTELSLEAINGDGSATTIYDTTNRIGDALGGQVSPVFSMKGYEKLRFACAYDNPRDQAVGWGVGDQEMCVLLAFTDSAYVWAGGDINVDSPGAGSDIGTEIDFTHACSLITADAN
jgi:Copper type II ascorbate-dependent monooxygenase, C-terminal domain